MLDKPVGEDWLGITEAVLPVAEAAAWATVAGCGGVVSFIGTVRDFSEGREQVSALEYEAYPEQVVPRLTELARVARQQWPEIGRIVMLHRVGRLEVEEAAVVVCASTPHRAEAFEVARYLIDTLKATLPIWKLETWAGGAQWSDGGCDIRDAGTSIDGVAPQFPHEHSLTRREENAHGGADMAREAAG